MVNIFNESDVNLNFDSKELKNWINKTLRKEGFQPGEIEIILLSNNEITKINKQFLNHPYPTDVITFGDVRKDTLAGNIFVGIEIVKENSILHNVSFKNELYRVIIHGVLHLAGYKDYKNEDRKFMRGKEDTYLKEIFKDGKGIV